MNPRVLFISLDPVGEQMAGLGIRYTELARALAPVADVTLAAPGANGAGALSFRPHRPHALRAAIAEADTVITHPQWPIVAGWLRRSDAQVVYDLYDPETLETLELFAGTRRRGLMVALTLDRLQDALATGDRFICASEKQRDLWIGALLAQRLIDPARYDSDASLRSLIDVVPFGVPAEPPTAATGDAIRARFPAIGADDEVVLWNGGIWRWLDAPTAIRGIALLAERRPRVRLVFMGGSPSVAAQEASGEARDLARELGLLDSLVFFNEGWVPYAERAAWLLDAACALSTHRDHLETRFAFRTRLLDCFWAGLPVVCTEGDAISERVERERLGAAVPPGSPEAVADAVESVLENGRASYADALAKGAASYTWPHVAEPLARWIAQGREAAAPRPRRGRRSPARFARELAYRAAGHRALDRRSG